MLLALGLFTFQIEIAGIAIRLHQLEVALLVPDDSLLRIVLDKKNSGEKYGSFFIRDKYDLFTSDRASLSSVWLYLLPCSNDEKRLSSDPLCLLGHGLTGKVKAIRFEPKGTESFLLCSVDATTLYR